MSHTSLDRLIALAGLYQAVHCVIAIARHGEAQPESMEPLIHSLFQIDAATTEEVYGAPGAVAPGARQMIAQMTSQPTRNLDMTRYVILLMRLERALAAQPAALARLGEGIAAARALDTENDLLAPALLAHFAELYSTTLSHLQPRLLIHGDPRHLRNPDNQNRVRTLLLAAIRSARLWRQVGGNRWQFLFGGRRLLEDARIYLSRC